MKKDVNLALILIIAFVFMFSFSFVIAENDTSVNESNDDLNERENRERNKIIRDFNAEDGSRIRVERIVEIEDGKRIIRITRKIVHPDGSETEVKIRILEKMENGKVIKIIKVEGKEIEAETELEIDEEETEDGESELRAKLSNGKKIRIKILPDRASEIAIERLKSKNLTIELKEVIHKNVPRVVYNIQTNKNGRFLGIFKLRMKIEAQIDPETGEFLGVSKPWWAFLVSGEDDPDDTVPDEPGNETTPGNETNETVPGNETEMNNTETNNTGTNNTEINNTNITS